MNYKMILTQLFQRCGIVINGTRDFDIQVHHKDFYKRVLKDGSLGLGESYMEGWWDVENLDVFSYHLSLLDVKDGAWQMIPFRMAQVVLNPQRLSKAFEIGKQHYDIGNDLYQAMLDQRLTYTCAYWKNAKNLNEAQEAKLDLVCRKLNLQPGQTVLDIGCGWGSFVKYAAEHYGIHAVGVTVSREQARYAQQLCKKLPIEIRLQDYRLVDQQFDHIVSLGMLEHVGYKNYRTYMEVVDCCLKPEGLMLLQTIGNNTSVKSFDSWYSKYIFPNTMIPSIKQLGKATEGLLIMEDWHNFGPDYDLTLMAWKNNFDANWHAVKKKYDEKFYRMWTYYLLMSAGAFRARQKQLWQIVLAKKGRSDIYHSVRL